MRFEPAGAGTVDGDSAVRVAAVGVAVGDTVAGAADGFPAPSSARSSLASRWAAMVTATGIRMTTATATAAITRPPMAIMADPPTPVITAGNAGISGGVFAGATRAHHPWG